MSDILLSNKKKHIPDRGIKMLIEKVNNGIYSQCRIPGIVSTENGTLLAYYECRKTNSDWADIDIKIIRSTDEGNTWQTVALFPGNGNTLNNPVMFVKGDELHFLFLKNYKELFYCFSHDDGKTFSSPEIKTVDCDFFFNARAVGPGHGIVHRGKMIVPIWIAQNKEKPFAHSPTILSTLYSTDGEKWQLGEILDSREVFEPNESALAVTAQNKVLISIRNETDCRMRAFALSDNGIDNWSIPHFNPDFPDPICMGSMCYDSKFIYHINCASTSARENLTLKRSSNNFETFESFFIDTPAGYSDIAVRNGKIYIIYERDCINGGLYFKKLEI